MVMNEEFFVAVAIVTFFVFAFKPLKKGFLSLLDTRIDKIKKDLSEAERLKNEAQQLWNEASSRLSESEVRGKAIIANAQAEAENIIKNTRKKLEKDIEVRKKMAMQKIQSFEESAVNELKKNISNITVALASQLIEEGGSEDSFKKLVNSSLDKLSKTIH